MEVFVDLSKVVAADQLQGEDEEEIALLNGMLDKAIRYLASFSWCEGIQSSYFGLGVGGVVAVFLSEISPARRDVDDWVWVIVVIFLLHTSRARRTRRIRLVLWTAIGAMSKWVEAAIRGDSVDDLLPVNVPATREWGESLQSRLDFLDKHILSRYEDDLRE